MLSTVFVLFITSSLSAQNVTITAPAGIAGDYVTNYTTFGPFVNGQAADIVQVDDGAGVVNGCDPIVTDLTGAIALIDRGACAFTTKTLNAQNAGAMAVIVCNNDSTSNDILGALGAGATPANCNITIPAAMLGFEDCQAIKMELANGAVSATMPSYQQPLMGESVLDPIPLPGAGTYTTTMLTGIFSEFEDSVAAQVYSVTAPGTGSMVMNVNSCENGIDTRLAVLFDICRPTVALGSNDDGCPLTPGDDSLGYASNLDVIVNGGESYLIHWDAAWDDAPHDFDVSFGALPVINVTYNVDMNLETVGGPVSMAFAAPGGMPTAVPMNDDGDGTYSVDLSLTTLDSIYYRFVNGDGTDLTTYETVPMDCAADFMGIGSRLYVASSLEDDNVSLVCFSQCGPCPVVGCVDAVIEDNLDAYAAGALLGTAAHWSTWDGSAAADGEVSTAQALSAPNSVFIGPGQAPDVLLLLGDLDNGSSYLKWNTYIPAGSTGYYNIQGDPTPGNVFVMEVRFNDGGGAPGVGVTNLGTADFSYPEDEWFSVEHYINLDANTFDLIIAGTLVGKDLPFDAMLSAIDFFSIDANNNYYIDDVLHRPLSAEGAPTCYENAIICDNLEGYADGSTTGPGSTHWTTWSGTEGGADDGIVTNDFAANGCNSMEIAQGQAQDVLLLLGNQSEGAYILEWQQYMPDENSTAYWNIQNEETPGVQWNLDVFFNRDVAGALTPGTGALSQDAATFDVVSGEWFPVKMFIDLDNDVLQLYINGTQVLADFAYPGNIGALNFFSIDDNNHYFIDGVSYRIQEDCGVDAIICDNFETYPGDVLVSGLADHWTPWSLTAGATDDVFVTTEDANGGANSLLIADDNVQDILLLLGNRTEGQYNLNWSMKIPAGAEAYWNLQESETPAVAWNLDVNMNDDGAAPGVGTFNQDATTFDFPHDEWFDVEMFFDLDNDIMDFSVNGTLILDDFAYAGSLGAVNIYSVSTINYVYLDDVIFSQIPAAEVDVTFTVNMNGYMTFPGNDPLSGDMHLAGDFQGWTPANSPMTETSPGIWTISASVPANSDIQYKFVVGNDWGENEDLGIEDCGVDNGQGGFNRIATIGDMPMVLDEVCYDECTTNCTVGTNDLDFSSSINMFPNPTSGATNIRYSFEEATDLNIRMMNNLGQLVTQEFVAGAYQGTTTINLDNVAAGIYFVHVTDGKRFFTEKLIVK